MYEQSDKILEKITKYLFQIGVTQKDCRIEFKIDKGYYITSSTLEAYQLKMINWEIEKLNELM